MIKFDKILADHDDVRTHGTMLYAQATDLDCVYADKKCTIPVDGEVLKDIYLKGCVVAIVKSGDIVGPFVKPVVLDITDGVYKLALEVEERLEGDGAEYYTLAPTALSFRSSAPLSELQNVQINGKTVDPSNYTLEEGSTIVTFPVEYLKTLSAGKYEVAVNSSSKTVKGNFTVAAPDLNDYGFYYNQPYSAEVPGWGRVTFFVREDGTYDLINGYGVTSTNTYTIDGSNIEALDDTFGVFHCTISSDGKEIYCEEVQSALKLTNDTSIAADADYMYVYKEDLGGYEVTAIDKTKAEYGPIKTGINGFDTVKLADNMFTVYTAEVNLFVNTTLINAPKIPSSVISIGVAFKYCLSLTSITIPNSVTSIGDDAFRNCSNLTNIVIPDSVTSIGDSAFDTCTSLTSVVIPDGVTSIGDWAFAFCSSLTSVIIPESVTSIGNQAFYRCENLKKVNISDIAAWCGVLLSDAYSSPLVNSASLYVNNDLVTELTIPDSVTSIGKDTFYGCTSLTSVVIPDSVTSIGERAFRDCTSLTNIVIPESVTSIGYYAFYQCSSLTSVVIPDSVTSISHATFANCTSLTSVVIHEGVTSIDASAFSGCKSLTSVVIPASVTSIAAQVFYGCIRLTNIAFEGTVDQWNTITKGDDWNFCVPATHVQCSDGTVALK